MKRKPETFDDFVNAPEHEQIALAGEVAVSRLLAIIDALPCDRERKQGRSCLSARELGVMVELCPMCAAKEAAHGR